MALFKVSYGAKQNLVNQTIKDGFCWYTPEDGKFYIDTLLPEIDDESENLLSADNTYVSIKYLNSAGNEGSSNSWRYTSNYIAVEPNTTYIAKDLFPSSSAGYENWHSAYLILYQDNTIVDKYNILLRQNIVFNTGTANSLRTSVRVRNYGGGSGDPPAVICTIDHMQKRNALSAIPVSYGVCAANSNSVIIPGISLQNNVPPVGAMICVNFAEANNGSTKNLIVNNGYINSNSIPIKTAASTNGAWQAGAIVALVYNGTNWIIQSNNLLENRFNTAIDDTSLSYSVLFSEEQASNNTNSHEAQILQKTSSFKHYPVSGKTATNSLALGDEHVLLEYNSSLQTLNFVFN